jgi:protein-S-isoprenylcysteine O-methyltransferase Ste14
MKVPHLGPRGEGWVVAQFILGGLILAAQWVGPHGPVVWALAFVGAGLALLGWAAWSLGPALTPFPRPRPAVRRVTTGPYRFLAHPMYVAVGVICVGATIHAPLSAIPGSFAVVLLAFKARLEREWLDETARQVGGDAGALPRAPGPAA